MFILLFYSHLCVLLPCFATLLIKNQSKNQYWVVRKWSKKALGLIQVWCIWNLEGFYWNLQQLNLLNYSLSSKYSGWWVGIDGSGLANGCGRQDKNPRVSAAWEACCHIVWDMEAMRLVAEPQHGKRVFGLPGALILKPDCSIGKWFEHGAAGMNVAGRRREWMPEDCMAVRVWRTAWQRGRSCQGVRNEGFPGLGKTALQAGEVNDRRRLGKGMEAALCDSYSLMLYRNGNVRGPGWA